MKSSKTTKDLTKQLDKEGFVSKIYVDKKGDPAFASAWEKDIVATKLFEEKDE